MQFQKKLNVERKKHQFIIVSNGFFILLSVIEEEKLYTEFNISCLLLKLALYDIFLSTWTLTILINSL